MQIKDIKQTSPDTAKHRTKKHLLNHKHKNQTKKTCFFQVMKKTGFNGLD